MRVRVSEAEVSTGFELAFPGVYQANVYANKPGKGPAGDYLKWEFELVGVTQNSEGNPIKGKVGHIFEVTTLKEGGKWRLSQLASAAGLDAQDFDTDDILGKTITVQVEMEKDEGYPARNVIKKFLPAGR